MAVGTTPQNQLLRSTAVSKTSSRNLAKLGRALCLLWEMESRGLNPRCKPFGISSLTSISSRITMPPFSPNSRWCGLAYSLRTFATSHGLSLRNTAKLIASGNLLWIVRLCRKDWCHRETHQLAYVGLGFAQLPRNGSPNYTSLLRHSLPPIYYTVL